MPQEKKDGVIKYQKTTTEYDNTGNVTEKRLVKKVSTNIDNIICTDYSIGVGFFKVTKK